MVPIPMADTKELPTPVIMCGFMVVREEKSDSTQQMWAEAPELRYNGGSVGFCASRAVRQATWMQCQE